MNERIKELAIESGLAKDAAVLTKFGFNTGDVTWVGPISQDVEKFAELIVGECMSIYSKIDNGNLHLGTDNYLEALHKTFRS